MFKKTWQKKKRAGLKKKKNTPHSEWLHRIREAPSLVLFIYFIFYRRRQAAIVFYAAVGTRQSVPHFEVRCSSLSAHSVLESPAGETYRAAWQPETVKGGGKEEGGKRSFFSSSPPLSLSLSLSRLHFSLREPTQT